MNASATADPWASRRRSMVEGQLRTFGVTDLALLAAFAEIPREAYVAPAYASLAYADRACPALGGGRLLLPPMMLGRLIQAANARPGERALDVAGGSGYAAAILAHLGVKVVALESEDAGQGAKERFADQAAVEAIVGDLASGAPMQAPFDVIVVNGAFELSPDQLIAQLADGGRLVGVDAGFAAPKAVLIEKAGGGISKRALFDAAAPRLASFHRPPQFAF